jgi:DNA repair exonuclease SbcCD ATPase subunit
VGEALARLVEKRARAVELEGRVALLEFLASSRPDEGLLARFKSHLISRIRPALARTASGFVARMTDGRYTEVELDGDYNVLVYDGDAAHPLDRFSGGETDVVNLALRLAINELVSQVRGRSRLEFIALDEIFGSQDADRRFHMLSALQGLSSAFRQVFVITHHEEVQERLEHVLHVVGNGRTGARVVPSWVDKV